MSHRNRSAMLASIAALVALTLVPSPMSAADAENDPAKEAIGIAVDHVRDHPESLGVTPADVSALEAVSAYRSRHNGVTHVNLSQRHGKLEVFGAYATVNIAREGDVIFAGGSLERSLRVAGPAQPKLGAVGAVEAAARALDLPAPVDLRILLQGPAPARETVLPGGGISDEPITARVGWHPAPGGLRLGWQLVIDDATDIHLWNATVDAETGELLAVDDWTDHDTVKGLAGTLARSDTQGAASASPITSPDPVADGSSYRVLAVPTESPNDAERALLADPADATGSPFGWHDTDAASGAEFTITRGNNVHAYLDQDNNNAADVGDTDGGAGLAFDHEADLNEHAQNYRDAVVTNLFYMNNVIHDVMYRYGFTEEAGNFQETNYVGGPSAGAGDGDYVRAEAADGGGTNNANFSTPSSAGTPRMQMYLWPGNQFGAQNQVVVEEVGTFDARWARFSPAPTVTGTSGELFDALFGCTPADYLGAPSGDWIALVTSSIAPCSDIDKVRQAEAAGAGAVIVASATSTSAPVLSGSMTSAPPTIPVATLNMPDGTTIRNALLAGPASGTVRKHPDHPGIRDGDFENGIIIHEYGHGISNRLTGGPGVNCLSGQEQMGEGWSDYLAITMLLDPTLDDPEGPRGMGPYALFQDSRQGAGIRPRPYSRNMQIQPATYDSIKSGGWLNGSSVSQPHGIGHVWSAFLWDLNWDLIDKHGFNPQIYDPWDSGGNNRALQYVIDGMKFQGCGPGFVVGRQAIVDAADLLTDGEDTCTVWASFARRGLGFSATQGSTSRNDNFEAFDTHPDCLGGFQDPVTQPYGELNPVPAGDNVQLRFTAGERRDLDILASNSPFSRQVDCLTKAVPSEEPPFTTPRARPIETETPGNSSISVNGQGRYQYVWQTQEEWAGTCRELVLTRDDGVQHRAFFEFLPPEGG